MITINISAAISMFIDGYFINDRIISLTTLQECKHIFMSNKEYPILLKEIGSDYFDSLIEAFKEQILAPLN